MEEIIIPVVILAVIICFSPVLLIISVARKKANQRKRYSSKLLKEYANELQDGTWFPVRYASKPRFKKIWKLFPWEDYGILLIQNETITFYSKKKNKILFPGQGISLVWVGAKMWPNGIIAWFLIRYENKEHYFTSDTGAWATKTNITTSEMYKTIKVILTSPLSDNS